MGIQSMARARGLGLCCVLFALYHPGTTATPPAAEGTRAQAVYCNALQLRDLGKRFPSILRPNRTECFSYKSKDMLSFGTAKMLISTQGMVDVAVQLNGTWYDSHVIKM